MSLFFEILLVAALLVLFFLVWGRPRIPFHLKLKRSIGKIEEMFPQVYVRGVSKFTRKDARMLEQFAQLLEIYLEDGHSFKESYFWALNIGQLHGAPVYDFAPDMAEDASAPGVFIW